MAKTCYKNITWGSTISALQCGEQCDRDEPEPIKCFIETLFTHKTLSNYTPDIKQIAALFNL